MHPSSSFKQDECIDPVIYYNAELQNIIQILHFLSVDMDILYVGDGKTLLTAFVLFSTCEYI